MRAPGLEMEDILRQLALYLNYFGNLTHSYILKNTIQNNMFVMQIFYFILATRNYKNSN